jgi:hypothetical protein
VIERHRDLGFGKEPKRARREITFLSGKLRERSLRNVTWPKLRFAAFHTSPALLRSSPRRSERQNGAGKVGKA